MHRRRRVTRGEVLREHRYVPEEELCSVRNLGIWSIKINRKEKRLAMSTAISSADTSDGAIVVEEFGEKFEKPKTKYFLAAMKRWGLDPKEKAMFLMMDLEENMVES